MAKLSQPLLALSILLLLAACQRDKPAVTALIIKEPLKTDTIIHLRKLKKLFVTGDFNGDKTPDTLNQHYYSALNIAK